LPTPCSYGGFQTTAHSAGIEPATIGLEHRRRHRGLLSHMWNVLIGCHRHARRGSKMTRETQRYSPIRKVLCINKVEARGVEPLFGLKGVHSYP
jgi:hypothetical protein